MLAPRAPIGACRQSSHTQTLPASVLHQQPPLHRRGSGRCHGSLKENVAALPSAANVKRISLPQLNHVIEPQPGKMASVAIYAHLASKYAGLIGPDAAHEALELYSEATDDARRRPGAHPNIDLLLRLLEGADSGGPRELTVVVEEGSFS